MKKFVLYMLAVLMITACTSQPKSQEKESAKKVLVLYFSVTNTTKQLAEYIHEKVGGDIEVIEAVNPYPADFEATAARWQEELKANALPEIKPLKANIDDYDIIFLGYPIWGDRYPLTIKTLIKTGALNGKVVVPFATSGSSSVKQSVAELKKDVPTIQVTNAFCVRSVLMDKLPLLVDRELITLGLIEGENEILPDYSEMREPTAEEVALFEQSFADYPRMAGTKAVSVASRNTPRGIDYKFVGENNGAKMDIFVTKEKGDVAPYFTAVDRS
ncbi:MAG: NAD(P)H-dependent oxidoreductase [Phocaeicola sp.]|nr:NAD(P)H-dependent oxidoreductase [Phocaeicola sp.]